MMKRIILAVVMVLSLAGASVFAQNTAKKTTSKPKNATAASSNTGGTTHKGKGKGKRHHKKSNSNSGGGTMAPKTKKGNKN
jgi:Ni/Co efflux regulator RcnB